MHTETMTGPRADEMRVRKMAKRQGYTLRSSRRRDPNALDFGEWRLITPRGRVVARGDLAAVEAWLATPRAQREG